MTDYLNFAISTAQKAGEIIKTSQKSSLKKSAFDIQADADVAAENFILNEIKRIFPEHSILSEESGDDHKSSQYKWIIDPLDGTINFEKGSDEYAVSIALLENDQPIVGVIYAPDQNKLYSAQKGLGAFLNAKKISVSKTEELLDSVGGMDMTSKEPQRYELFDIAKNLSHHVRHLRIYGSSALHLAKVAEGKLDFYFKNRINYWDVCAGSLLVQEAGGTVIDFIGNAVTSESKTILASTSGVSERILNNFKN